MKTILQMSALAVLLSACGQGDAAAAAQDELSAGAKTVVSMRADGAGGYFVRDVNKKSAEVHVASLDLGPANLDTIATGLIKEAPAGELLLFGKLGPLDAKSRTRAFQVYEAYRGMPGIAPVPADAVVRVTDKSRAQQCVAAPCLNQLAAQVNGNASAAFSDYSVDGASKGFVDQLWLTARIRKAGAMAKASIVDGPRGAGGVEKVLAASQVFLKLPIQDGLCPKVATPRCGDGQVSTLVRNEDRCLIPSGCVTQGVCTHMLPACAADYTLVEWRTMPNGCPAAACDPTFTR